MNMGTRPRPQEGPIPVDFEDARHLLEGVHIPLHAIGKPNEIDSGNAISLDGVSTSLRALRNHGVTDLDPAISLEDGIGNMFDNAVDNQNLDHMVPDLGQITESLWFLENRLPHDHPDIINLREAMVQLGRHELEERQRDPQFWEMYNSIDDNWQSNLGPTGNPYENDDIVEIQPEFEALMGAGHQEHAFVEAADMLEHSQAEGLPEQPVFQEVQDFQQPEFVDEIPEYTGFQEVSEQEPMLEEMVEQEFVALGAEQSDMEMLISEAGGTEMQAFDNGQPEQFNGFDVFDANPAFDEINQAIDQAAAFEEPEMDPWEKQDPYQQMAMTMDMQMQYMANPFGMPKQMGPGFGPMPGSMMYPM